MEQDSDTYKIVVIGGSGVGKTNISTRFARDTFSDISSATLGVEFMTKILTINGSEVKISLWDTAGQQRYKALSKVYYKGANAAVVVYDITDAKSYLEVESWMKLLNENLNIQDIVIAVVGNKKDLESGREIPSERALQQYKQAFDIDCWEVSAKTNENIQELFIDIVKKIRERIFDAKSTMYRGTVEYQSQRGTLVPGGKQDIELAANLAHPPIIIQEEQDERSIAGGKRMESIVSVSNRMTLNNEERRKHQLATLQARKGKCCFRN